MKAEITALCLLATSLLAEDEVLRHRGSIPSEVRSGTNSEARVTLVLTGKLASVTIMIHPGADPKSGEWSLIACPMIESRSDHPLLVSYNVAFFSSPKLDLVGSIAITNSLRPRASGVGFGKCMVAAPPSETRITTSYAVSLRLTEK